MKYESYKGIIISDDLSIFDFVSVGKYGNIPKRIEFSPTEIEGIYNLAFGNTDGQGVIDDYSISNNGDRNKILATVFNAIETYLNAYPDRWIYFRGSSKERTRLYRMAVGLNIEELSLEYEIYAEQEEDIVPFLKNITLLGLLVKRK